MQPQIMSILNVTPDSFSDGGEFENAKKAYEYTKKLIVEGANIIDVGGESSAPGSSDVCPEEEWKRIAPILEKIIPLGVPVSVDTWKSKIAQKALDAGVQIINDITAFRGDKKMISVVQQSDCKIVIMYSKNTSARTTLEEKKYDDVIREVGDFFEERLSFAKRNGIQSDRIILDTGMGAFLSSNPEVSFETLHRLPEIKQRFPKHKILIGTSRKGFLKHLCFGKNAKDRLIPSVVSSLIAIQNGADIVRVHDTKEMKEAIDTCMKIS